MEILSILLKLRDNFSWRGLVMVAVILLPSILLVFSPPSDAIVVSDNILLSVLENVGRVAVIVVLLFSGNSFTRKVNIWFALGCLFMLLYYIGWVRYFLFGQTFELLYAQLLGVPVPLAVFPVLSLAAAAIWIRSKALGLATLIMALGHIPASLAIYRGLHG